MTLNLKKEWRSKSHQFNSMKMVVFLSRAVMTRSTLRSECDVYCTVEENWTGAQLNICHNRSNCTCDACVVYSSSICVQFRIHIYIYVCFCDWVCASVCMCFCMYAYVCMYVCVCVCMFMCVCVAHFNICDDFSKCSCPLMLRLSTRRHIRISTCKYFHWELRSEPGKG